MAVLKAENLKNGSMLRERVRVGGRKRGGTPLYSVRVTTTQLHDTPLSLRTFFFFH